MNRTLLAAAALLAAAMFVLPRAAATETARSAQCIHIAAHGEPAATAARVFMDRQIAEGRVHFTSVGAGTNPDGRAHAGVLCAW